MPPPDDAVGGPKLDRGVRLRPGGCRSVKGPLDVAAPERHAVGAAAAKGDARATRHVSARRHVRLHAPDPLDFDARDSAAVRAPGGAANANGGPSQRPPGVAVDDAYERLERGESGPVVNVSSPRQPRRALAALTVVHDAAADGDRGERRDDEAARRGRAFQRGWTAVSDEARPG